MLGEATRDRRAERHEATREEIIAAAWEVAREKGVAGLTLQDVARKVGMRAPSLYSYFDSKHAVYDAMFADGYRRVLAEYRAHSEEAIRRGISPRQHFKEVARLFVEMNAKDPARYQLLFQRTIPGFEPSAESYAIALEAYELVRERFGAIGISDQQILDLYTSLTTGLSDQQISNDPGGDRWTRLVDEAIDMFLDHIGRKAGRRIK